MRDPIEHPGSLMSRIRCVIDAAATMPRAPWLMLRAMLHRAVRPILDARREHALRRARYWGTYG